MRIKGGIPFFPFFPGIPLAPLLDSESGSARRLLPFWGLRCFWIWLSAWLSTRFAGPEVFRGGGFRRGNHLGRWADEYWSCSPQRPENYFYPFLAFVLQFRAVAAPSLQAQIHSQFFPVLISSCIFPVSGVTFWDWLLEYALEVLETRFKR